jgi:O-acetyl-ADP-ribose deacetylase (regulator of RNase III)
MIEHVAGNLLEADAEAFVNTVNTVGVMGKGIALQFRQAFPENYAIYRSACERGEVQPGRMLVVPTGQMGNPRYIINFPTKRHWKGKSRMEDIEAGLPALIDAIQEHGIRSVAVPPLGCGNGGLDWNEVRPRIEAAFAALPDVHVLLYAPAGAPDADEMRVNTSRPRMTAGRAAIIALMKLYAMPGYRMTLLEIQKLAYFLQIAGQPLKLSFVKGKYGPYSETVQHVLQRMEGHFIRGYGDRSREASIRLLPPADSEAEEFLRDHPATQTRLNQVAELIEGFETPYGMELLATVHWLVNEEPALRDDPTAIVRAVHNWNVHKQGFPAHHIQTAWSQLRESGWLEPPLLVSAGAVSAQ